MTCGAAPAPSPGHDAGGAGRRGRPAGREECSAAEREAAGFDSPPSVGLLRLHFPSSSDSEIKERHTRRESGEHPRPATGVHPRERRGARRGERRREGRGAHRPGPSPAPSTPPPEPPLRTAGRRAHSFQMSLFPLILGSVSPCVWLSSCSASSLPPPPRSLCIFSWRACPSSQHLEGPEGWRRRLFPRGLWPRLPVTQFPLLCGCWGRGRSRGESCGAQMHPGARRLAQGPSFSQRSAASPLGSAWAAAEGWNL